MKHTTPARALSALIAVAGLFAGGLTVSAQTPPPLPPGPPGPMMPPGPGMPDRDRDRMSDMRMDRMPANDAEFVRMLAFGNSMELAHAKFIMNRTKDPQVHAFAQRMIDDHSTAAVQLQAATRGVGLRPAPSPRIVMRDHDGMDDMGPGAGAGANLDAMYMRMQVPAHKHVLALLQWEQQHGTNAGLKTLASNLQPTVQQHLQLAQAYLTAHHLTPYTAPMPGAVPGHVNPNGNTTRGGTPNNPAAPGEGSTRGTEGAPGGTTRNPLTPPSAAPLGGNGTPAPGAGPTTTPVPVMSTAPSPAAT